MRLIQVRNVNNAFVEGLALLDQVGQHSESRAGDVVTAPYPVMTVYSRPTERVLMSSQRDANPFFHLFESLWMLSGSNDAKWLDQFVHDFSSRFAEEGGVQWGAYGHRWRRHWDADQLDVVVRRLRSSPTDRRVVISMWDPSYDLWDPAEVDEQTGEPFREPRDLPCNTHLYVRIREEPQGRRVLDLTVCCRSNDMIWGAYGANAVHFSVLLEYLAGRIGVDVGRMYQLSNNFHVYTGVTQRMLGEDGIQPEADMYSSGRIAALPMGDMWERWDADVAMLMEHPHDSVFANVWFGDVAVPMLLAHQQWRAGDREAALQTVERVAATDWREAARAWMQRRAR